MDSKRLVYFLITTLLLLAAVTFCKRKGGGHHRAGGNYQAAHHQSRQGGRRGGYFNHGGNRNRNSPKPNSGFSLFGSSNRPKNNYKRPGLLSNLLGSPSRVRHQHVPRQKSRLSMPNVDKPHDVSPRDAWPWIGLGLGAALGVAGSSVPRTSVVATEDRVPRISVPNPPSKSPARAFLEIQPKCGVRSGGVFDSSLTNSMAGRRRRREANATGNVYVYAYIYEDEEEEEISTTTTTVSTRHRGRFGSTQRPRTSTYADVVDGPEPDGEAMWRIVGGESIASADSSSYPPWQASLRFNDAHVCGGSLISSQFIVTAAHCFKETSSDPSLWTVYLGKVKRTLGESAEIGPLRVSSVAVHPQYGDKFNKRFDADIALIYLAEPVRYTRHAYPICLPQEGQDIPPDQMCVITGFGDTKNTGDEGSLKEAKVPIIDTARCRNSSRRMAKDLSENMICAGYLEEGGTDSCQGDSGGPLACPANAKGDVFVLNGIISWGYDCGARNSPGVYTRVSKYINWLRQTTAALTAASEVAHSITTQPPLIGPLRG